MKETTKRVWWKVPLYSAIAGFVSYWIMVGVVGRFVYVKLPDGTVSSNDTLWLMASAAVFIAALLIGGLLFFRKMTRKEILCSATVLFFIHAVLAILSSLLHLNALSLLLVYTREWYGFVVDILLKTGLPSWLIAAISWASAYQFVLFGKKDAAEK